MFKFIEFLDEARVPNMFDSLSRPTVDRSAPQLFHKDIGLPIGLAMPQAGLSLRYGFHAQDRQAEKIPSGALPKTLPNGFTVIEAESVRGKAMKWVVRFPFTADSDLVLVITMDGFVKTLWLNKKSDLHKSLNRSAYLKPNQWRNN